MFEVIGITILALAALTALLVWNHRQESEPDEPRVTKEAKREAIRKAKNARTLDALWRGWERSGWSKDGLLYAELLQRKKELGARLSSEDEARISAADARWKHAKGLPTIKGRGRR